ncbi:hypothetical protein Ahy_B10g104098 isoform D [Arachis hypogaea]|uniref:Uncharacterized protein n=1 Tax=Arachis hypogaea TaxID=3818 RepID=A0A444X4P8_ARAHY|nr:hypothetical protein Ahy_B10g104098 isoform D [Arachis hypogaea]
MEMDKDNGIAATSTDKTFDICMIDGKPEDVLNPKKKQLEKITPNLFTDEKGVATFKGIPFMTSGGPCTSSIAKATIK